MILQCQRCHGQHLEFDMADPRIRRCLDCGAYEIVEDDHWQVGDRGHDELIERPLGSPVPVAGV